MARLVYGVGSLLVILSFSFFVFYSVRAFNITPERSSASYVEPDYHFVLVTEEMDNDYWRLVEEGARKAAEEYNVALEYTGPKQANLAEHIKTIEMAAAARVDGIMAQGLNQDVSPALINRVVEKGIPFLTVDTDAPNSKRFAYIGTDNYYAGFLAGQALLKDTEGDVNVGIITGRFDSANQKLRVEGFKDAIQDDERVKVVAIDASQITRIQAAEKTYEMIKEHPEVNAFYGTSALDAIGIVQVLESIGMTDRVYVIGFDVLPETIKLIEEGKLEATVVQKPYEMGFEAVKLMVELKEGKEVSTYHHTLTEVIHLEDINRINDTTPGGIRLP
ncbi:sugar-binding protein [Pseudalkalibacillus hwajinpoensis]|uniref:sugar-binding protein n=1 Tax=Guptibacillus hwajinpoensis TaxID=208199 RepID=UPI00325AE762